MLFTSTQPRRMSLPRFRPSRWSLLAAAVSGCLATIAPAAIGSALGQAAAPEAKPAAPAGKSAAQPTKQAKPVNSLDDALLEDLDNDLLDGVKDLPVKKGRFKKKPAASQPADNPDGDKPAEADRADADQPADDAEGEMTEGRASDDEEPLARIGQQMRTVEKLLQRQKAADNTQRMQGQILSDLEALIKKLEQQCQKGDSSGEKPSKSQSQQASRDSVKQPKPGSGDPAGQPSNKPAKESTERLGKNDVQKPDLDAIKGLLKDAWGQLPPHAREQMLQSPPEQFLPKYELLIEKYYKRLAEEQKQKP